MPSVSTIVLDNIGAGGAGIGGWEGVLNYELANNLYDQRMQYTDGSSQLYTYELESFAGEGNPPPFFWPPNSVSFGGRRFAHIVTDAGLSYTFAYTYAGDDFILRRNDNSAQKNWVVVGYMRTGEKTGDSIGFLNSTTSNMVWGTCNKIPWPNLLEYDLYYDRVSRIADFQYACNDLAISPNVLFNQSFKGKFGSALSEVVQLAADSGPITSMTVTGLPSWASFNFSTRTISGTPTSSGRWQITITASNAGGTHTQTAAILISGFLYLNTNNHPTQGSRLLPNLTNAEMSNSTGDIRKVMLALAEDLHSRIYSKYLQLENFFDKMTVSKKVTSSESGAIIFEYEFDFDVFLEDEKVQPEE